MLRRVLRLLALLLVAASGVDASNREGTVIDEATWADHDARPVPKPAERDPNLTAHLFREAVVEQFSHAFDIPDKILWALEPLGVEREQEAGNVNAFDEVPNSTWFTNRNHVRALAPRKIRGGPFDAIRPAVPWTIKGIKKGGVNPGFQIKDANDKRWVIKLDPPGYTQAGSGAGVVSSRLIWAAGYNFSHDEAVTFLRKDLKIDEDLVKGSEGPPFTEEDLDRLLERGARGSDGRYYASASLFIAGKPIGPMHLRGKRSDDPNDWYTHKNRRELRGLFVFYAWINNWDVKEHQSLDTFETPKGDSLGHVTHYLLDAGASLGAAAEGPKAIRYGYEQRFDLGWTAARFFTLGFIVEPWRRARQNTGIPSVGNFESEVFDVDEWRPIQYIEPFRRMTDADGYWGAKLVASFSDAQIAAAIDAAGYEDPRAPAFLFRALRERRDKVARHWFDRVAPLDFFHVQDGMLRFHDLAVDMGITDAREYELEIEPVAGGAPTQLLRLSRAEVPLGGLDPNASGLNLKLHIAGGGPKPVRVELTRRGSEWAVTRVRHG